MATFNHAPLLRNTLRSIYCQKVPFEYEVIVANDGSIDDTRSVLEEFPQVKAIHLPEKAEYLNPSKARNAGYRAAKGDVIICQSDDVEHRSIDAIERLCSEIQQGTFLIAGVRCDDAAGVNGWLSHSVHRPAPFFFLGSVFRSDLYAVGGNDERFIAPSYDDNWFADCLVRGRGLKQISKDDILAFHQNHDRGMQGSTMASQILYSNLVDLGRFCTEDAPWSLE
jgi:glycosyltransferase involved in cell wall biosynthesis